MDFARAAFSEHQCKLRTIQLLSSSSSSSLDAKPSGNPVGSTARPVPSTSLFHEEIVQEQTPLTCLSSAPFISRVAIECCLRSAEVHCTNTILYQCCSNLAIQHIPTLLADVHVNQTMPL